MANPLHSIYSRPKEKLLQTIDGKFCRPTQFIICPLVLQRLLPHWVAAHLLPPTQPPSSHLHLPTPLINHLNPTPAPAPTGASGSSPR